MGQSVRTGQSDGLEPRSDHLDSSHTEIMDAVKNTLFPGAGGTDSTAADGVPWWMKYVAKALAILSAVAAMFYGALAAIAILPDVHGGGHLADCSRIHHNCRGGSV